MNAPTPIGQTLLELGPISSDMTNMVVSLKKMDFAALQGNSKVPGFLKKILGLGTSLAKFQAQFDSVQDSVAKAEANLQSHRIGLLQDIKMLDVLYARTDEHLDDLEAYILAAERVLEELNTRTIPEAKIKADTRAAIKAGHSFPVVNRVEERYRQRAP